MVIFGPICDEAICGLGRFGWEAFQPVLGFWNRTHYNVIISNVLLQPED